MEAVSSNASIHNVFNVSEDTRVYDIVSIVAYLSGVSQVEYAKGCFKNAVFEHLHEDIDAHIIRSLARIRTAIMKNYKSIHTAMTYDIKNINSLPDFVPAQDIAYLDQQNVNLFKANTTALAYIVDINLLLTERISRCERLFPLWIKWPYIKEMFLMPSGQKPEAVEAERLRYIANISKYPYNVYLNLSLKHDGNLFFHDGKFLHHLYQAHQDEFTDRSKVTDAGSAVRVNLYQYVMSHPKIAMTIDCENSDPYRVCSLLRNLQENCPDGISHICKVTLYDDVHTSVGWQILERYTDVPITYEMIERVQGHKSLVDIRMTAGTCKAFYEEGIPAFMLVSSDSDYWGLMTALPKASFLVLAEREKCGVSLRSAMESRRIDFCYMDDFYSGNISDIKLGALMAELRPYLEDRMLFNINSLLNTTMERTRISLSESEKDKIRRHIKKNIRLYIADNWDVKTKY